MSTISQESRPILLIEDDHDDFAMEMEVFKELELEKSVYRIVFGPDALFYLRRTMGHQKHVGEPLPRLIIVDLRLPGADGQDIVREITHDKEFNFIPVIVMSGLVDEASVRKAYEAGACGYIPKGTSYDEFHQNLKCAIEYWTKAVRIPTLGEA